MTLPGFRLQEVTAPSQEIIQHIPPGKPQCVGFMLLLCMYELNKQDILC